MHLVLYIFEKVKQRVVWFQSHHPWRKSVKQFGGVVAVVFCQSGYGYIKLQLVVQHLPGHLHLAFAAIHYQQLRQRFVRLFHTAVATIYHLRHRGVVVGTFDGLDIETAVLATVGLAVCEPDQSGDRVGSLYVAVVERLYMYRQFRQLQHLLYAFEQVCLLTTCRCFVGVE